MSRAYDHWIWPVLGFCFLPLTTLTFAFASSSLTSQGQLTPFGWLLVALAVCGDLGLIGGGGQSARRWRERSG